MNHVFRVSVLALAFVATVGNWSIAEACDCPVRPPPTPDLTPEAAAAWERKALQLDVTEEFRRAVAVFSGDIVKTDIFRVRFKVDRVWKGKLPPDFLMRTGARRAADGSVTTTSCDYYFPRSGKFFVFAFGSSIRTMRATSCTHTSDLRYAQPTMDVLNAIVQQRDRR
jgi:hypothetical protein